MSKETIAFIGTGIMGAAMAGHLLDAGYPLRVYNRTKAKAQPLLDRGALWCDSPGECAQTADFVITIVGYPRDVEEVYFATGSQPGGILACAKQGAVLIDMTTSSPQLALRISEAAREGGLFAIDAPVSGGDAGAKAATLSIMLGGEPEAVRRAMPLLRCMGKSITHIGGAGAGQHTKMANQIALAGALAGAAEALAYASGMGLDAQAVLQAISGGAAGSWQLSNNGPKMLAGDYTPGFYTKHYCKDMDIALAECEAKTLTLPVLRQIREEFAYLQPAHDDDGTQALYAYYTGEISPTDK